VTSIATLQAGGDTRTPLVIGIGANIIHVAMNAMLIPVLGARGAATSTAVTFLLQAVFSTAALTSRSRPVSLRGDGALGPLREEAKALARISVPSFAEKALYHIGFVGYVFLIARLGDDAMAANQSLISIESICFLSADGFGIAAAALVAQKIGAQKPEEGWKAAWIATRYAIVTLTVFGAVAFALRDVILPMFSPVPHVVAIGREAILVLALAQPFMATGMVLGQALRGAARTVEVLVISIVGAVLVRLSATWFFGIHLGLGLVGVWLGSTTDWLARCLVLGVIVRRTRSSS
jgi:putative MATE family efflux protein